MFAFMTTDEGNINMLFLFNHSWQQYVSVYFCQIMACDNFKYVGIHPRSLIHMCVESNFFYEVFNICNLKIKNNFNILFYL